MQPRVATPKLVLVGDSGVGKTALGRRFATDTFVEGYAATVGADTMRKRMTVHGIEVDLAIWDTAGQEVYRSLTPQYFRDASLAVIVFSLVDAESLKGAEYWINSVHEAAPTALLILAGNKVDLSPREINFEQATEFAEKNELGYVETSAVTGQGVNSVFETLVEAFLEQTVAGESARSAVESPVPETVVLRPPPTPVAHTRCC
jgi:small GTP-binding protein